ncbi:MAG: hypothetical protein M1822_000418 [Bathelium mastoideum]|nr:MAG: hypothetical protein M1822_000418 [Bathelium mastoideum]
MPEPGLAPIHDLVPQKWDIDPQSPSGPQIATLHALVEAPAFLLDEVQVVKQEFLDHPSLLLPVPLSHAETLSMTLDYVLQATEGTGRALRTVLEFLPGVPCRIGQSAALDASIECMLLAHQSLLQPSPIEETYRLAQYGTAIRALREELDQTDGPPSTETVCAALTISGYEIASCLISGSGCFLDQSPWQSLLQKANHLADPENRLSGRIVVIYAMLPALLRDARAQQDRPEGVSKDVLQRAWKLRQKCLTIQPEIDAIFHSTSQIREVLCKKDSGSPFDTYYVYDSIATAQTLSLYWRIVMLINKSLQIIGPISPGGSPDNTQLSASSLAAAEHLLKTVEYTRDWRPYGSIHLLAGLPLAHDVYTGNLTVQKWILSMIDELSDRLDFISHQLLIHYVDAIQLRREDEIRREAYPTTSFTPGEFGQ